MCAAPHVSQEPGGLLDQQPLRTTVVSRGWDWIFLSALRISCAC